MLRGVQVQVQVQDAAPAPALTSAQTGEVNDGSHISIPIVGKHTSNPQRKQGETEEEGRKGGRDEGRKDGG